MILKSVMSHVGSTPKAARIRKAKMFPYVVLCNLQLKEGICANELSLFQPTDGRYINYFNTNIGAIIAYNNFGPAWMARRKESKILPDIRAWSDVVFVDWKMQADATGDDIQGLKYVIRYEVANPDTLTTVEQAAGDSFPQWPGLTFPMSDERALAILGTPNGAGIAYLLATHKEQLGHKTIESVNVWWREFHLSIEDDSFNLLFIAFKIVPVASSSGPSTTE
jgi:hypothetical protein